MINLNSEEYFSKKYRTVFEKFGLVDFDEAELTGANIIFQKEDGSCFYLEGEKCSIHNDRPQVCRKFFCDSKEENHKLMIEKIKKIKEQ